MARFQRVLRGKRAWYVKRVSFEDKRDPIRSGRVSCFTGKPDKNPAEREGRLMAQRESDT